MSDIVETLSRRAETLAALSNCDVPKKELKSLSWLMEATGELRRAAKDNVKAADEITRLRQLLSKAEKREREARANSLEEAAQVAERDVDWSSFGKRDIQPWENGNDSVRDYRLGIATGRAIAVSIRALQSEER